MLWETGVKKVPVRRTLNGLKENNDNKILGQFFSVSFPFFLLSSGAPHTSNCHQERTENRRSKSKGTPSPTFSRDEVRHSTQGPSRQHFPLLQGLQLWGLIYSMSLYWPERANALLQYVFSLFSPQTNVHPGQGLSQIILCNN